MEIKHLQVESQWFSNGNLIYNSAVCNLSGGNTQETTGDNYSFSCSWDWSCYHWTPWSQNCIPIYDILHSAGDFRALIVLEVFGAIYCIQLGKHFITLVSNTICNTDAIIRQSKCGQVFQWIRESKHSINYNGSEKNKYQIQHKW